MSTAEDKVLGAVEVKELPAGEGGLSGYESIRYLLPGECVFTATTGGFLALTADGTEYPRVGISRAFPLTYPTKYLSVRDKDGKEIGIIEDLGVFSTATRDLVMMELERRYFTPSIHSIRELKEEFGYTYWEVDTDRGIRRFTSRGTESVIDLKGGRIMILDVDGNRYDIPDLEKLDPKSAKLLDALI